MSQEKRHEKQDHIPSRSLLICDPFQCPDEVRDQDVDTIQVQLEQFGRVDEDAVQDCGFE